MSAADILAALRLKLQALPRFSFLLLNGGVTKVPDSVGAWVERDAVTALLEPEAVDALRATLPGLREVEPMARFCPGCGSVGPVPEQYRDCCPDSNKARMIPESLAHNCRDLFQLALRAPSDPDELAAPPSPAPQPAQDGGAHVGDSAFESWFSTYNPAGKGDKQRARDAYAAGMGDPLVVAQDGGEVGMPQSVRNPSGFIGAELAAMLDAESLALCWRDATDPGQTLTAADVAVARALLGRVSGSALLDGDRKAAKDAPTLYRMVCAASNLLIGRVPDASTPTTKPAAAEAGAVEALRRLAAAVRATTSEDWICLSPHPTLLPALENAEAALAAQPAGGAHG